MSDDELAVKLEQALKMMDSIDGARGIDRSMLEDVQALVREVHDALSLYGEL